MQKEGRVRGPWLIWARGGSREAGKGVASDRRKEWTGMGMREVGQGLLTSNTEIL